MANTPADRTHDAGGVWDAPSASATVRPKNTVPAMPPPTGPLVALPTAADKKRGGRKALIVVSIVVAALVLIGVAVAKVTGPIFHEQEAKAADTDAKIDVATLGMDIQIYFIDNAGPPPEITVVDGHYHLDAPASQGADNDAPVSPGVVFGGVSGTDYLDWCVWVVNPNGNVKYYQFSSESGLDSGNCD